MSDWLESLVFLIMTLIYTQNKYKQMAKKSTTTSSVKLHLAKPKKKRPGVHSKKKSSNLKTSKNYKKLYRGQGR